MKFGFDKPYFPIQKVDKPEMDEQIIIKPSRSFGLGHLEHVYHMIVAHAFNAGIKYANSLLKNILPDEFFNRQFAKKYIEFNPYGVYRICDNAPEYLSNVFKKGEDYLMFSMDGYYQPKRFKDKSIMPHCLSNEEVQEWFYRPFNVIETPERSVAERQDKKYSTVHKDVNAWGYYLGEVKMHKWPVIDDVKEQEKEISDLSKEFNRKASEVADTFLSSVNKRYQDNFDKWIISSSTVSREFKAGDVIKLKPGYYLPDVPPGAELTIFEYNNKIHAKTKDGTTFFFDPEKEGTYFEKVKPSNIEEKKETKKTFVPFQESPGVFVPGEVSGIVGREQRVPRQGQLVTLKIDGVSDSFKKGDIVKFTGKIEVREEENVYLFEHYSDAKKRIGFPESKLSEAIDFIPSLLDAFKKSMDNPFPYNPYYSVKVGDIVSFSAVNFFWNNDILEKYKVNKNDQFKVISVTEDSYLLERVGDGKRITINESHRGIMFYKVDVSKYKVDVNDGTKCEPGQKCKPFAGSRAEINISDVFNAGRFSPKKESLYNSIERNELEEGFYFNIDEIFPNQQLPEVYVQIFYVWPGNYIHYYDFDERGYKTMGAAPYASQNLDFKNKLRPLNGEIVKRNQNNNAYILFKKDDSEGYFLGKHGEPVDNCPSIDVGEVLKDFNVSPWYYEQVVRAEKNNVVEKGIVTGTFECKGVKDQKEPVNSFEFLDHYNKTGVISTTIRKYWLTEDYSDLNKNTVLELMGNKLSIMTDKSPFKVLETEHVANVGAEMRIPNKLVRIFTVEEVLNFKK
jgi:hypothetical protein